MRRLRGSAAAAPPRQRPALRRGKRLVARCSRR
jgi:hypothetical protein